MHSASRDRQTIRQESEEKVSLSNPRTQSPVRKYFRVKAGTGSVVNYDKGLGKELEAQLPFRFIVLDVLSTVGGFHEPSNSGIWGNEVRSVTKDVLRVRNGSGVLIEGVYPDIKDRLRGFGGKFANSVYIAYQERGEWTLGNINFVGASLSEWFDFSKARRLDADPGVAITGFSERKKGRTEYFVPEFQGWDVSSADVTVAAELDRALQTHLNASLGLKDSEPQEPTPSFNAPQPQFPAGSSNLTAAPPF